jgi:hypothetical protein
MRMRKAEFAANKDSVRRPSPEDERRAWLNDRQDNSRAEIVKRVEQGEGIDFVTDWVVARDGDREVRAQAPGKLHAALRYGFTGRRSVPCRRLAP